MQALIPLFVAVPLAVAFVMPWAGRWRPWVADWLANATLVCLVTLTFASLGTRGIYHMGGWPTPIGIDLRLDPLASLLLFAINLVGLTAALYSVEYMRRYTAKHRYYSLFLFLVAGMNGVVLAGDLFNLYVLMEIAAVASYALVAFGCEHEELEAAFKYLVLGTLASSLILIAVALVYAVTGTLNMAQIAGRVSEIDTSAPLGFALALFLCGFGLKAALVPFHTWLPDAHPSAPAPVSAMLSGVLIKAIGIYVLARLLYNVFGANDSTLEVLRWMGIVSMMTGGLLATGQWDMKRLFAYSSISQVGYIVLGLGIGTPLGVVGALYHLINHSAFKSLLFLNAGAVEYATGSRDLRRLGGLNRAMPVTGVTSLVASMSIAGIPPFNGFWSKLIIVVACVQAGFYGFAAVAMAMSIVTLGYQLRVQRYAFFEAPGLQPSPSRGEPRLMAAAMIVLAIGCVALSSLVVAGMDSPWLVGPAKDVLLSGLFVF
ncbi:MAG: complex I subunit 5 family protein [Gammaproteobacteria bacterium]